MHQPKPISRKYDYLVRNVTDGIYQIPKFQRNFVWNKEQSARLIDSLLKGFPIGSFILWKTKERMRAQKCFGDMDIQMPEDSEYVHYVLDGQQRITSLFLAMKGITFGNHSYEEIYVDLDKNLDGDDNVCVLRKPKNGITVKKLTEGDFLAISDEMGREFAQKAYAFEKAISGYEFSTIEIEERQIDKVAEMFTRINTGGTELTLFAIANARFYQEQQNAGGEIVRKGFDLENEVKCLAEDLEESGYETIAEEKTLLLQLMGGIVKADVKQKSILSIDKSDFISSWGEATECLKLAIDKVRDYLRVPVSKLLPYPALLVPIAYLYYKLGKRQPSADQMKHVSKYFFRAVFTGRYSSTVETMLNQDLKLMAKIEANEAIDFDAQDGGIHLVSKSEDYYEEQLLEGFRTSNAFNKGVLCILAQQQPKKLDDGISNVRLDNSWLHIASSRNYHHFFPKGYLKGKEKEDKANVLANIVFVDDYLNKRKIRSKAPSIYIEEFRQGNSQLRETLNTHFIDLDKDGIQDDDYDRFLKNRSRRLAGEILKRIL